MAPPDLFSALYIIAFSTCFFAGCRLVYIGLIRIFRDRLGRNGIVVILLGILLLAGCRAIFFTWYHGYLLKKPATEERDFTWHSNCKNARAFSCST